MVIWVVLDCKFCMLKWWASVKAIGDGGVVRKWVGRRSEGHVLCDCQGQGVQGPRGNLVTVFGLVPLPLKAKMVAVKQGPTRGL
jgi:hypothetical protein